MNKQDLERAIAQAQEFLFLANEFHALMEQEEKEIAEGKTYQERVTVGGSRLSGTVKHQSHTLSEALVRIRR